MITLTFPNGSVRSIVVRNGEKIIVTGPAEVYGEGDGLVITQRREPPRSYGKVYVGLKLYGIVRTDFSIVRIEDAFGPNSAEWQLEQSVRAAVGLQRETIYANP